MENENIEKIDETKSWLARLAKEKGEKTQINTIRNEREGINNQCHSLKKEGSPAICNNIDHPGGEDAQC